MGKLQALSLKEKAALCSGEDFWHLIGIERLGIPQIMVSDGPHGLRKQKDGHDNVGIQASYPATCFPTAVTLAATWDKSLIYAVGEALGEECLDQNVNVLLGPGINIKRSPLCGRNFEYFSEDPHITGELATAMVRGIQSKGVGTSLKHFAVNNQEKYRMTVDAVVDERTLREIYLSGFEKVIKEAKPTTVMCAYNKVNGKYCSENKHLLTEILRDEWGFDGAVVSDWGATHHRVRGIKAGMDLEMPSSSGLNEAKIIAAVQSGELLESELDQTVERLLQLIDRTAQRRDTIDAVDYEKHHQLARKAAGAGMVLLKNEHTVLPFSSETKIALLGRFSNEPRYQGAGSSLVNPAQLPFLKEVLNEKTAHFQYFDAIQQADLSSFDVVLLAVGLPPAFESEGFDRTHMHLPEEDVALINAATEGHNRVVVLLMGGSPVEMDWADRVEGILLAGLGGQAICEAIVDVLYGHVNPSGKLAETYPIALQYTPTAQDYAANRQFELYKEGLEVGYRHYDTHALPVRFPFGHGLSYTTFAYKQMELSHKVMQDTETLKVRAEIMNTGQRYGEEVVQLYISDVLNTSFRVNQELKAFEKVGLNPGQSTWVTFHLTHRDFAYYSVQLKDWHVPTSRYEIKIGASSRDHRLLETVTVQSSKADLNLPEDRKISLKVLEMPVSLEKYHWQTTLDEVRHAFPGNVIVKLIRWQFRRGKLSGDSDPLSVMLMDAMLLETPIECLVAMSEGAMPEPLGQALIHFFNRKYMLGFKTVFGMKK